jgi:hypothetical protein
MKDIDVITRLADGILTNVSYSSTQTKCVFLTEITNFTLRI